MAKWTSPVLGALAGVCSIALVATLLTGGAAQGQDPPSDAQRGDDVGPAAITPTPELLYVSVTPCRIVDTRLAGGAMGNNTTRDYYVTGTTGFVPQGGKSGGCGIPAGAKSIAATFTAVTPSHGGYMRAWATGGSAPTATLLNYGTFSMGTGATVPIRSGTAKALTVRNFNGPTHLVIDVAGYYIPQMQGYVSTSGTIIDQSGRIVSAVNNSAGTYTITWDRDVSTCSGVASSDISGHILSVYMSGNISYVYIDDNAGNAANYWFHIAIHC